MKTVLETLAIIFWAIIFFTIGHLTVFEVRVDELGLLNGFIAGGLIALTWVLGKAWYFFIEKK